MPAGIWRRGQEKMRTPDVGADHELCTGCGCNCRQGVLRPGWEWITAGKSVCGRTMVAIRPLQRGGSADQAGLHFLDEAGIRPKGCWRCSQLLWAAERQRMKQAKPDPNVYAPPTLARTGCRQIQSHIDVSPTKRQKASCRMQAYS